MLKNATPLLLLLLWLTGVSTGYHYSEIGMAKEFRQIAMAKLIERRVQSNESVVECDPSISNCTDIDGDHHEEDDHHDGDEADDHQDGGDHVHDEDGDHDGHNHTEVEDARNQENNEKPWGPAILAALLVNLCTLIGVVIFVPASLLCRNVSTTMKSHTFHIMIPSFACGALVATALFLLIPEALILLSGGHSEEEHDHRRLENSENEIAWKFGASVLGGYFIPFVFAGFFPHSHVPDDNVETQETPAEVVPKDEEYLSDSLKEDVEYSSEPPEMPEEKVKKGAAAPSETSTVCIDTSRREIAPDYRLACTILAGDFFHNFADGIFIGTSFLVCARSVAITVTATTVFHELSQELADYLLLTNQCGLTPVKALALNFLSGLSVMLGVITIMAINVAEESIGVLLSMSAGVYFYIAFTECSPRVNHYLVDTFTRGISFAFWVMGIVPIGLVLLSHEHCDKMMH